MTLIQIRGRLQKMLHRRAWFNAVTNCNEMEGNMRRSNWARKRRELCDRMIGKYEVLYYQVAKTTPLSGM